MGRISQTTSSSCIKWLLHNPGLCMALAVYGPFEAPMVFPGLHFKLLVNAQYIGKKTFNSSGSTL
jgi:hypothetical protein